MRIYFMSICGTGMGNAAILMRSLGHEVTGADQNTYPPMSDRLAEAGVEVLNGYDADRLAALQPDLVVVGNVNTRGNPEVEWLLDTRSLPFTSLPELLSREILSRRRSVVVAGTHGKTTTTALTTQLLRAAGIDAGCLIGGVPLGLETGASVGDQSAPFVIEGDEYDSAFFDKRSKFIHYCPNILLLNNLEYDHADIFRDLADVKRTFTHLLKLVPKSGYVIANSDDANVESLLHLDWVPVLRVGTTDRADLRIVNFHEDASGSHFELFYRDELWKRVSWRLWGLYNARNGAMAALAAALASGASDPLSFPLSGMDSLSGVKRRQEVLAESSNWTLLTDFAHHPTAVRETLHSLRARFPEERLLLCFEARSNTSCRKIHETEFELAFDAADEVHLGSVFRPERYPENDRIDFEGMAARMGEKAVSHGSNAALESSLMPRLADSRQRGVLVFFSNGSFDAVPLHLAEVIRKAEDKVDACCGERKN